jgi:threonyl-tRNA synthetase
MHGLIRVRQFTLSEGHIILRPEQLEQEFKGCIELANFCLETLGLAGDVSYRFSQWDPNNREKYEGTAEQWENAQSIMGNILDNLGIKYSIGIGEAAFYGPKLDIQIKNVFGKEDTLITIQIDPILAEKFGMEYVDTDGKMRTPYIIHRSSLGCYERTLALIIEKYAGALPLWLAPEQIRILPVTDRAADYAAEIERNLASHGVFVTTDNRNEKIGFKIRQAQLEKIPYFFIVGDNEVTDKTVSLRSQKAGDLGVMPLDDVIGKILEEIRTKGK